MSFKIEQIKKKIKSTNAQSLLKRDTRLPIYLTENEYKLICLLAEEENTKKTRIIVDAFYKAYGIN